MTVAQRRRMCMAVMGPCIAATVMACTDGATEPPPLATPRYELVTSFSRYSYSIGPCPGSGLVTCHNVVAPEGARLAGILAHPMPSTERAQLERYLHPLDPNETGPRSFGVVAYEAVATQVWLHLSDETGSEYIVLYGTAAGDSIVGDATWTTTPKHSYYHGTFVMRPIE